MEDREAIKARLLTLAELAELDGDPQSAADIRAALERDDDQGRVCGALGCCDARCASTHSEGGGVMGLGTLDEIHRLREENDRLRWVVKGAHGALTDACTVIVPGVLDGDLAPAIRQITRERDEAREKLASLETDYAEAQDIAVSESAGRRAAEAEVARSHDAILHLTREVARLEGLILDWWDAPEGKTAETATALCIEARRIRAKREDKS